MADHVTKSSVSKIRTLVQWLVTLTMTNTSWCKPIEFSPFCVSISHPAFTIEAPPLHYCVVRPRSKDRQLDTLDISYYMQVYNYAGYLKKFCWNKYLLKEKYFNAIVRISKNRLRFTQLTYYGVMDKTHRVQLFSNEYCSTLPYNIKIVKDILTSIIFTPTIPTIVLLLKRTNSI
ncbi:hypothetical protein H8356DRAFT_1372854 [Neocallimastix lanati (nom. inval.)]|nr:hypothetical protein H8356DRAFT_1372854 [Neocallimastix sp. JGI-2020a]